MAEKINEKEVTKVDREKRAELARKLRYMRDKDRESVTGKFIFHEVPGGGMSFVIKLYKEDEVERYDLVDGEVYKIPLGVAKHLNKNGWYPEYSFMPGDVKTQGAYTPSFGSTTGNIMKIGKQVRRFSFQSLEFMDIDDLASIAPSQIVTVEQVV